MEIAVGPTANEEKQAAHSRRQAIFDIASFVTTVTQKKQSPSSNRATRQTRPRANSNHHETIYGVRPNAPCHTEQHGQISAKNKQHQHILSYTQNQQNQTTIWQQMHNYTNTTNQNRYRTLPTQSNTTTVHNPSRIMRKFEKPGDTKKFIPGNTHTLARTAQLRQLPNRLPTTDDRTKQNNYTEHQPAPATTGRNQYRADDHRRHASRRTGSRNYNNNTESISTCNHRQAQTQSRRSRHASRRTDQQPQISIELAKPATSSTQPPAY